MSISKDELIDLSWIAPLKQEVLDLRATVERLKKESSDTSQHTENQRTELKRMNAEAHALRSIHELQEKWLKQAVDRIAALEAENATLTAQLGDARHDSESLESNLDAANAELVKIAALAGQEWDDGFSPGAVTGDVGKFVAALTAAEQR